MSRVDEYRNTPELRSKLKELFEYLDLPDSEGDRIIDKYPLSVFKTTVAHALIIAQTEGDLFNP